MAQYRAGRVTVTLNSDIVNGLDTDWLQSVDPGDVFLVRGEAVPYRVASVASNTSLRLNARYAGPTQTNTFYSVTRDFTPNYNLPIIQNGDVDAVVLFAEALVQLDSKLGPGGGGGTGGGGGGGSTTLAGLTDVSTVGSLAGDNLVKLPNGSYGFVRPYVFTLTVDHAPGDGGRIVKSYSDGVFTARRIKVAGGTITENPDDLTINVPAPGEVNTLASAGTAQSQSLVVAKSGTILRTKGIRASGSITLTPEGNDLVIGSTATGTGGAVTYTLAPIGSGVSLVATPSGTELRVKTLSFDGSFTVSQPAGGGVNVALNNLPITRITNVLWETIEPGQLLYRNAAGNVSGINYPSPGLSSIEQDTAPRLGGPIDLAGNRVIGQPVSFSGMIEDPLDKSYTLCLSAPVAMRLTAITVVTEQGVVGFRVDVGSVPEEPVEGETPQSALQAQATTTRASISAASAIVVDPTQPILLTLFGVSALAQGFSFTLVGATT